MSKSVITKLQLESLPRLTRIIHNESNLYLEGNKIYKIINPDLRKERIEVVKSLKGNNPDGTVAITDIIFNEKLKFIGYEMEFLSGYQELLKQDLSIEQRIKIAKRINVIFKNLLDLGYLYNDIGPNNIMTNGIDTVYIDMDASFLIKSLDKETLKHDLAGSCDSLALLTLSVLLNQDFIYLFQLLSNEKLFYHFSSLQDDYVMKIVNKVLRKDRTIMDEHYVEVDKIDIEKVLCLNR